MSLSSRCVEYPRLGSRPVTVMVYDEITEVGTIGLFRLSKRILYMTSQSLHLTNCLQIEFALIEDP